MPPPWRAILGRPRETCGRGRAACEAREQPIMADDERGRRRLSDDGGRRPPEAIPAVR